MERLARSVKGPAKIYFTGGATALLLGFREQTIDVDVKLDPEPAGAFEAIAALKNDLEINVDATTSDFIPASEDWRQRSRLIKSIGAVDFYHFDFALQALSKLERGYEQDIIDVRDFVHRSYLDAVTLRRTFAEIEPNLVRYPAIDPISFKRKVEHFLDALNT